MNNIKKRRKALRLGYLAEYFASVILFFKGYSILQYRFRSKYGEIDVIARKGNNIIFVEVKARKLMKDCVESITQNKKQKLLKTINYYITTNQKTIANKNMRIDAIFISLDKIPKHIKNIN